MRLFHFSDEPDIAVFTPRPVRVPVERPSDQSQLNGPLVWAIDAAHAMLYLFPRECPRILIWPTSATAPEDRLSWFEDRTCRARAYIEQAWWASLSQARIYRYELPIETFEPVGELGMWVSRAPVRPLEARALGDLPGALAAEAVEINTVESLLPLKPVWKSSMHASGLRLRNVEGWGPPGWPHSRP